MRDLKEAFAAGFEAGRKVFFYNGRSDLDERIRLGFEKWYRERFRGPEPDYFDKLIEEARQAPCPGCKKAPAHSACICIPF